MTTRDQRPAAVDELLESWEGRLTRGFFRGVKDDAGHEHDGDGKFTGHGGGGGSKKDDDGKQDEPAKADTKKSHRERLVDTIRESSSDPAHAEHHAKTMAVATRSMSEKSLSLARKSLRGGISIHPTEAKVNDEYQSAAKALGIGTPPESAVSGFYNFQAGSMCLDGNKEDSPERHWWQVQVYAHETAHAIDGPQQRFSASDEWHDIWKSELCHKSQPIGDYATVSAAEGFAEAGRMVFCKQGKAKQICPRAHAFFEKYGLIK